MAASFYPRTNGLDLIVAGNRPAVVFLPAHARAGHQAVAVPLRMRPNSLGYPINKSSDFRSGSDRVSKSLNGSHHPMVGDQT